MRTFDDVEIGRNFIIPMVGDVMLPFAPVMKKIDRRAAESLSNGFTRVVASDEEVIELRP